MTEVIPVSRRLRFMVYMVFAFVVVLFALLIFSLVTGGARSHEDIIERIDHAERQLSFLSCIVLTQPADRTPEAITACQISPNP